MPKCANEEVSASTGRVFDVLSILGMQNSHNKIYDLMGGEVLSQVPLVHALGEFHVELLDHLRS